MVLLSGCNGGQRKGEGSVGYESKWVMVVRFVVMVETKHAEWWWFEHEK